MKLLIEYLSRTWFYAIVIAYFSISPEPRQSEISVLYSLVAIIAWVGFSHESVKYLQRAFYGFWVE